MVEHGLIGLAPLRGGSCGPCAIVGLDPVAVLIIVACAGFLRTPVDLGDDDGRRVDYGHLLMELCYLVGGTGMVVAAAIPSAIVVDGIAYVVALNGIGGIALVVGLPTSAGHPDDACEASGTYLVDDGLEIVVKGLRVILSVGILQTDGLVGELDADLSVVLADVGILREDIPDGEEVVLIVVAHLEIAGTDTRRTNHDVHAMVHGALHQREVEGTEIVAKALGIELADIGLTGGIGCLSGSSRPLIAAGGVVSPGGLEVEAEDSTVSLLESGVELFEVVDTALAASIIIAPAPASAVEPG